MGIGISPFRYVGYVVFVFFVVFPANASAKRKRVDRKWISTCIRSFACNRLQVHSLALRAGIIIVQLQDLRFVLVVKPPTVDSF